MKNKVEIKVMVDTDTFSTMASFNLKNNIHKVNLNHLPFNHFECIVNEGRISNKEIDQHLDTIMGKLNIPKKDRAKFKARHKNEYSNKDATMAHLVDIDASKNRLVICVEGTANIAIDFKDSEFGIGDIEDTKKSITGVALEPVGDMLKKMVETDKSEKERFESFCITTISNIMHLLIYISSDSKVDITKDMLYDKKEYMSKEVKQQKKKNGKKKKSSVITLIKNVEYKISRDTVIRNIEEHTPRKYERQTEEWFTKGYWRKYKSGKMVWIKPTIKRAKNIDKSPKEKIEKTYKVK